MADTPDPRPVSRCICPGGSDRFAYNCPIHGDRPVSPPSELTAAWSTLNTYIIRCGDPAMGTPTWNDALDALEALSRAARVHEDGAAQEKGEAGS